MDPEMHAQFSQWTAAGVSEGLARRALDLGSIPDRGPGSRSMRRRLQTQAKHEEIARKAQIKGLNIPNPR